MENASFFNNSAKGSLLFGSKTINPSIPLSLQFEVADPLEGFISSGDSHHNFFSILNLIKNELSEINIFDEYETINYIFWTESSN